MDDISVLVCDDSALMRNLIGRIVDETTGLKVCGKAENGQDLLEKIPQCNPDVILLDIEMLFFLFRIVLIFLHDLCL